MPKAVKDPRSTGRKRARRTLERTGRPYACECVGNCRRVDCGSNFTSDGKCGYRPQGEQSRSNTLDANHKNKNWLDNDPANLEWLCRPCHRAIDRQTEKGVENLEFSDSVDYSSMLEGIE